MFIDAAVEREKEIFQMYEDQQGLGLQERVKFPLKGVKEKTKLGVRKHEELKKSLASVGGCSLCTFQTMWL